MVQWCGQPYFSSIIISGLELLIQVQQDRSRHFEDHYKPQLKHKVSKGRDALSISHIKQ